MRNRRLFNLLILLLSLTTGFGTLWFTQVLVEKLKKEEHQKVLNIAGATRLLSNTSFSFDNNYSFIIDIIQSIFFKILGTNWFAYIFHSSIANFLISLIIYYHFQSLKIDKITSLFFTFCFSTLAYTVSGTPFVDHHAIFFLLASTVLIIKAIDSEKNYLWFFIVFTRINKYS